MDPEDVAALEQLRGAGAQAAAGRLEALIQENDRLRQQVRDLERFRGVAIDAAAALRSAGEAVGQSLS